MLVCLLGTARLGHQCNAQLRHIAGAHTGNAPGLRQRAGPNFVQLFPGLQGKPLQPLIDKTLRDQCVLVALQLFDLALLASNVARIFDLGFNAPCHHGGHALSPANNTGQQIIAHPRAAQQLHSRAAGFTGIHTGCLGHRV